MGLLNLFKSPRDDKKESDGAPDSANVPPEAVSSETEPNAAPDEITAAASPEATGVEVTGAKAPVASDAPLQESFATEQQGDSPPPTAPEAAKDSEEPPAATPPALVDFESEFAALVPPPETAVSPATVENTESETAPEDATEAVDLEEWSEPLPSTTPPALSDVSLLEAPNGSLKIESYMGEQGGENVYRAVYESAPSDEAPLESRIVRLREASGRWGERLAREAMWRTHWDATTRIPMLPDLVCSFSQDETTYLATDMPVEGQPLAQFFTLEEARAEENKTAESHSDPDMAAYLSEVLLILTQLAAFLVRLHGVGFAHLALRPDGIALGKPVQILDCSFASPLGETLEAPLSFAGYSAPELSRPDAVDARSDLYAVGALLYRAVTGADVPESGADFTTWQPRIVMAGIPQILRRTLGALDTRYNSAEELHRALVKLKSRLRPSIAHSLCGLSTIGLEGSRSTNQDAFGFQSGAWETESGTVTWTAFCVADGMGGMAAGEVASEVAVATFLRAAAEWSAGASSNWTPLPATTQAQLVKEWAALANEAVVKAMEARHARGGCTIDAGFVIDRRLCIAHVGDSRLYLLRAGQWEVLSRDHSFVMSLLLQGQITFDDIRTHGDRNKVTRSLGERHPQPDYFIDGLQTQKGEPALELQNGDVLLACSDGLWEPVLESEMLSAVGQSAIGQGDLTNAARHMLRLALQRGAPDNATVVLLRLEESTAPVFA